MRTESANTIQNSSFIRIAGSFQKQIVGWEIKRKVESFEGRMVSIAGNKFKDSVGKNFPMFLIDVNKLITNRYCAVVGAIVSDGQAIFAGK